MSSQIFGWSDGVRFRTKYLSSTKTDYEHRAIWVDFGPLIKLFAITTCRKTATTACHVAGFLREQAIPIPIPPILMNAFSSLSPVHVAYVDFRDESRAGPSSGNGGVTLKSPRLSPALTLVLSPQQQTACRSEGAEVVFRRRVQWRHCRYLPPATRVATRACSSVLS